MYIPENNRKNPTKCAGNWGTEDEFQCGSLNCDDVFDSGVCEHSSHGFLYVHNIYERPEECPYNTPTHEGL